MNKLKIIIVFLLVVLILSIFLLSNSSTSQYKVERTPNITAENTRDLLSKLIRDQESFMGNVSMKPHSTDNNKVQITIHNKSINDDSIGEIENVLTAEKIGNTWKITQNKYRWKCARSMFIHNWTVSNCI